jgi:hypothetical protein
MKMIVEKQMECRLAGETEILVEKNIPSPKFLHNKNPAGDVLKTPPPPPPRYFHVDNARLEKKSQNESPVFQSSAYISVTFVSLRILLAGQRYEL